MQISIGLCFIDTTVAITTSERTETSLTQDTDTPTESDETTETFVTTESQQSTFSAEPLIQSRTEQTSDVTTSGTTDITTTEIVQAIETTDGDILVSTNASTVGTSRTTSAGITIITFVFA